jgi:hypothetical protein
LRHKAADELTLDSGKWDCRASRLLGQGNGIRGNENRHVWADGEPDVPEGDIHLCLDSSEYVKERVSESSTISRPNTRLSNLAEVGIIPSDTQKDKGRRVGEATIVLLELILGQLGRTANTWTWCLTTSNVLCNRP